MTQRNKITISFLPSDKEIWEFIKKKKQTCNISQYFRDLILRDMNNGSSVINVENIVERILRALENNELSLPEKNSKSIEDILVEEEAKNMINSLF